MAQTRPIGWATFGESAASPPLGAAGRDLRFSSSRARCVGSARRRRMCSRLLFRRCSSSAPAGWWSQIAALADSSVRSSGIFSSPLRHVCLSPPVRFCCVTCITHRSRDSLNDSPGAISCNSHHDGQLARPQRNPYSFGHPRRANWPRIRVLFLKYCDGGTIALRTLHVTVPSLPPLLGRRQSGEGRPMGSTHPPLESLLNLSQNCLEGFELSRLNRISNLRKEFREILDEWIEFEIESRFARWILQCRDLCHFGSLPNQTALPTVAPTEFALPGVARVSDRFPLPSGNELPPEFPFASMVELGDSVALELRLRFRYEAVSQDAAAALRSLEHSARCEARSIGDQPIALPNCDALDSSNSRSFLSFPPCAPRHELRNVSSQMSIVLARPDQSASCVIRYSSTFVTNGDSTPSGPRAMSEAAPSPRPPARASHSADGCASAPRGGHSELCLLSPFHFSLRQFSLRRAAILLRN